METIAPQSKVFDMLTLTGGWTIIAVACVNVWGAISRFDALNALGHGPHPTTSTALFAIFAAIGFVAGLWTIDTVDYEVEEEFYDE